MRGGEEGKDGVAPEVSGLWKWETGLQARAQAGRVSARVLG